MKKYSTYVEFYTWKNCMKSIFRVRFTFKTYKELVEKTNKFCETEKVKLLHKCPLAPHLKCDAFNGLPNE